MKKSCSARIAAPERGAPLMRGRRRRLPAGLVDALSGRREEIKARWESLLRIEQVKTPLAEPDMLVLLFDDTLDRAFARLAEPPDRDPPAAPYCFCGRNPLLAYFRAGEQALLEILVLAQTQTRPTSPERSRDEMAALQRTVRSIAREEIGAFAGLCQHRPGGSGCRRAACG